MKKIYPLRVSGGTSGYLCSVALINEKHTHTQAVRGVEAAAPAEWVYLFSYYLRQNTYPLIQPLAVNISSFDICDRNICPLRYTHSLA